VRKDYQSRVAKLLEYIIQAKGRFEEFPTGAQWILEYLDHLFFEGWNLADGTKLLAAVRHHYPAFRLKGTVSLSRVERSLQGWKRHSPARFRSPLPWHAVTAIAGYLLNRGLWWESVAILMAFIFYLRPGELLSLVGQNLVAPMAQNGVVHWVLVLRDSELTSKPTKTGQYEEGLALDLPVFYWFAQVMEMLKARCTDTAPIFSFTAEHLNQLLTQAAARLHLGCLCTEIYALRHGGASYDAAMKFRDSMAIKRRLRHASDITVRRYERSGRLALELQKMEKRVRDYGARMEPLLGKILTGEARASAPPLLGSEGFKSNLPPPVKRRARAA